ncbi:MAG: NUDIX domain-containing protein [Candidatus Aenigmatarchaeota archaeon]|nr:MAG: NUDIX domain-containing protein [Candidatus Aenigmarchaeota archaeon]
MTEYLYHVDKEDNVIDKVERNHAHSNKLLHRSGVVLVFDSKQNICLAIRSPLKEIFPSCIDSVCSFHVKYGQTYLEAVKEELFEETGIKAKPEYLGKFLLDEDPDHMIVAVFSTVTDERLKLDPEEAISHTFYDSDKADELIKNEKTTSWLPEAWDLYKKKPNP